MPEPDWFEVVESPALEQGDLLFRCPVPLVPATHAEIDENTELDVDVEFHDLCVLTQSCDLVNDKVKTILLGRVWSWKEVVEASPAHDGKKMRKKVKDGLLPGMCLLHRRREDPALPWSVVDFRSVFVLPRDFVRDHAGRAGSRLRLRSPYREHLAQAFARYFMRVGLPHDAEAFVDDPGE